MNKTALRRLIVSSVLATAAAANAQDSAAAPETAVYVGTLAPKPEVRQKISISYRMGLNITADFKRLGGFSGLSNPGPSSGGQVDRTYDDGYNLIDVTGNDHGPGFENTTWNWGYSNPGSVQGDTLVLTSSSSPATAVSKNNSDDPQHGFEIAYSRELWQKGKWRFGAEAALGYSHLSISEDRRLSGTVITTTDTYTFADGFVPPPAPYSGSFNGPGPVIPSAPIQRNRAVTEQTTTIVGRRELDANIYALRLGPYVQYPIDDKFNVSLNGGLYLAIGDTRFTFAETVTISGVGAQTRGASGTHTEFLVGGYVGGNIEYALTDEIGLFVGAQFQTAGRSVNRERGKESVLDLGEAVIVSIGASYSF